MFSYHRTSFRIYPHAGQEVLKAEITAALSMPEVDGELSLSELSHLFTFYERKDVLLPADAIGKMEEINISPPGSSR